MKTTGPSSSVFAHPLYTRVHTDFEEGDSLLGRGGNRCWTGRCDRCNHHGILRFVLRGLASAGPFSLRFHHREHRERHGFIEDRIVSIARDAPLVGSQCLWIACGGPGHEHHCHRPRNGDLHARLTRIVLRTHDLDRVAGEKLTHRCVDGGSSVCGNSTAPPASARNRALPVW